MSAAEPSFLTRGADRVALELARLDRYWATAWLAVAGLITLAYALTAAAGGTSSGLPHLFYLPIFAGAFVYGPLGGLVSGAAAGVVCALLPVNDAGTAQDTRTWLVRLIAFLVAGVIIGVVSASLRRRVKNLELLTEQVATSFVRAIDSMHRYTAEHSTTVADHAVAIARALALPRETVHRVHWAALLHDVGKLSVPTQILDKPGPLTPAEREVIRGHVDASVRILESIDQFHAYLPAIRHHHERWDGSGYPDRLQGQQIPLEARIIAVADTVDAITSTRAYRPAHTWTHALNEIRRAAGHQLDPGVVETFIQLQTQSPAPEPANQPRPQPTRDHAFGGLSA